MAIKAQQDVVLVLGSTGKIGRMLLRFWADKPSQHIEFLSVSRNSPQGENGLIWEPGKVPPKTGKIWAIVALWGVTPGPERDLDENSTLAIDAMELGRALGVDRVLHCSSAAVYGGRSQAFHESDDCHPANPYGVAKLAMERAVADWCKRFPNEAAACCMRIGNVAGAESLFRTLKAGGPVSLDQFDDGNGPRRSYIGPRELAQVIEALCLCPRADLPETLNVAAPVVTSMESIARAAGREVIWRPAPPTAVRDVGLATERLDALCPMDESAAAALELVTQWRRWGEAS